jgi:hypothetical protein
VPLSSDLRFPINLIYGHLNLPIQQLPECGHQPLASFLIWPIQRLTRYHLLLRQYQKYLTPNCPDWHDTEMALVFALKAASDVNEMVG